MTADASPRAVVVDDSTFMRTVISDILESGGIDVVGEAGDGEEALAVVAERDPDVVTMDVEMPVMSGLEAVEALAATDPTPVLVLSAHADEDAAVTFEALEKGAVDFFTKPGGEISVGMTRFKDRLVRKVRAVAASTPPSTETTAGERAPARSNPASGARTDDDPTLVIGASTGGPSVVESVVSALPREAGLSVLVVQHMPADFTRRYADRLDEASDYRFREAADGDRIESGEGCVAPGGYHLAVESYRSGTVRVGLSRDRPRHGVRPAIDVTMETAAATVTDRLVGVVLTGMGRDGAAGVTAVSDAGGDVIVQDEATSAVFGMPKRAIETGRVDAVVPAEAVARTITETVTTSK